MPLLSPADREQLAECGFVVARQLVAREKLRPAIDAMCSFLGVDYDRPRSWHRASPASNGIVPIHQAQAFWDTRQEPQVHQVFAELLGTPRLWVTMDRGSFKPPLTRRFFRHRDDSAIHWDCDLWSPGPLKLQGVLYLDDTGLDQGGFRCVPGIYQELWRWIARQAAAKDGKRPEVGDHPVVQVAGGAGDLIIWTSLLPHGSGINVSSRPRVAQYISMEPVGDEQERQERVELWRTRRAPAWWRDWPGQQDPEPGSPAALSPLGRKLLGLDRW